MTSYEKDIDDDRGRAAMKAARLARSKRTATPPALDGLLPNVVGDDEYKLRKLNQGANNNAEIDQLLDITPTPQPGIPVTLQLLWNGAPIGTELNLVTPVSSPQTLVLPGAATTGEGVFSLGYRIVYSRDDYDYPSPVPIFIDKTAPNRNVAGAEIVLPPTYADKRITKERLEAEPVILLTIPLHSDRRTEDVATVYMGISEPGMPIGTYTAPDDSSSAMEVNLTKLQVENGGEGNRIIYYRWKDRVGNEGPSSEPLEVVVALTAAPSNLKPLEVPEAPDPDNLITIRDAYPDVGVVIEAYDNIGASDEVALSWEGIAQPRKLSSSGFPMIFDVPYAHVRRNGLQPRAVTVAYSVWRGASEYPETTTVPVNVDLRRPGTLPPDPEEPEVGNPNLSPVKVKAENTPEDNTFELIDAGFDGKAFTIIDPVREVDDVYQLFWGGVAVPGDDASYTVDGSETDGDEIEFIIPHAFITAQGNGAAIPVHYEITNPGLPDNNPNPSLRQPVSVYVNVVSLPTPVIKHVVTVGGQDFLDCVSLRSIPNVGAAAVVEVPGGTPLAAGMELAFTWSGERWDGTTYVPVPDYPFTKTLSGNEHVDGFTVYLPHDAALQPIKEGRGGISYTVEIDNRTESSLPHDVIVVMRRGDGSDCPIPSKA